MQLTKEQIKIAKKVCTENGINAKLVTGIVGQGFWEDKCNSSFEGYLQELLTPFKSDVLNKILLQSKNDYANGNYGASKFR